MVPAITGISMQTEVAQMPSTSVSVPRERTQLLQVSLVGARRLISGTPLPMVYAVLIWCFTLLSRSRDYYACKLFQSKFSFSYSCIVFLVIFPVGFQNQAFGELVSTV